MLTLAQACALLLWLRCSLRPPLRLPAMAMVILSLVLLSSLLLPAPEQDVREEFSAGLPPSERVVFLRRDASTGMLLAITGDRRSLSRAEHARAWQANSWAVPPGADVVDVAVLDGEVFLLTRTMGMVRWRGEVERVVLHEVSDDFLVYQCERLSALTPPDQRPDCENVSRLRAGLEAWRKSPRTDVPLAEQWRTLHVRMARQSLCGLEVMSLGFVRVRVEQSSITTDYCPYGPGEDTLVAAWQDGSWKVGPDDGGSIRARHRQPMRSGEGLCRLKVLGARHEAGPFYARVVQVPSSRSKREPHSFVLHGPAQWLDAKRLLDLGEDGTRLILHQLDEQCEHVSTKTLETGHPMPAIGARARDPEAARAQRAAVLAQLEGDDVEAIVAPYEGGVVRHVWRPRPLSQREKLALWLGAGTLPKGLLLPWLVHALLWVGGAVSKIWTRARRSG